MTTKPEDVRCPKCGKKDKLDAGSPELWECDWCYHCEMPTAWVLDLFRHDPLFERVKNILIENEQELDGRWISEMPSVPGAMAYGDTQWESLYNMLIIVKGILQSM